MNKLCKSLIPLTLFLTSFAAFAGDKEVHHLPGVFLGFTNADSETEFTYGVEYEYKFNKNWGAGVIFETTPDGHSGDGVDVRLAQVFYHPTKVIRLGAGFGEEKIKGKKPKKKDIYRLSASYDFHVGNFGIAPTLAVDFIEGGSEAFVFGVAIIRPF